MFQGKERVRYISKVLAVGSNWIQFERPLPYDVRLKWKPVVHRFSAKVSGSGFENFQMLFEWSPYTCHIQCEKGMNAIQFFDTANSWVSNLKIVNGDMGVAVSGSDFVTLTDITTDCTKTRCGRRCAAAARVAWDSSAALAADAARPRCSVTPAQRVWRDGKARQQWPPCAVDPGLQPDAGHEVLAATVLPACAAASLRQATSRCAADLRLHFRPAPHSAHSRAPAGSTSCAAGSTTCRWTRSPRARCTAAARAWISTWTATGGVRSVAGPPKRASAAVRTDSSAQRSTPPPASTPAARPAARAAGVHNNLFTNINMGLGARMFYSGGDQPRGAHSGANTTWWSVYPSSGAASPLPTCDFGPLLSFFGSWLAPGTRFRGRRLQQAGGEAVNATAALLDGGGGVTVTAAAVTPWCTAQGWFVEQVDAGKRPYPADLYAAQVAARRAGRLAPRVRRN